MAARCDFSDLPTDSCSHCLKQPDPEQQERRELAALLSRPGWIPASYRGQCGRCEDWFGVGMPIHIDRSERVWIGGCCADTLGC